MFFLDISNTWQMVMIRHIQRNWFVGKPDYKCSCQTTAEISQKRARRRPSLVSIQKQTVECWTKKNEMYFIKLIEEQKP